MKFETYLNEAKSVQVDSLGRFIRFRQGDHNASVWKDKVQYSIKSKSVERDEFVKHRDGMAVGRVIAFAKKDIEAYFKGGEDLKPWMNPDKGQRGYLQEAKRKSKFDYQIYHNSYTSAVDTGLKHAEVKGYTTDPDEVSTLVGFGPKKPGRGKTTTVHIPIYKNDKPQKKALHIVVYNRETESNPYELTAYIL